MPTFTEILPARPSSPRSSIEWTPAATLTCGVLVIRTKRKAAAYRVDEFASHWDGRCFHFAKLSEGSDTSAAGYDVFCGRGEQSCDCRGYASAGHCKHLDAAEAILANEFLWEQDLARADAEAYAADMAALPSPEMSEGELAEMERCFVEVKPRVGNNFLNSVATLLTVWPQDCIIPPYDSEQFRDAEYHETDR